MDDLFNQVKSVPTIDVVQAFFPNVDLKRDGSTRWKGLCPFHQESTPSFTVFDGWWKCFGCGAGTTNIDLLLKGEKASDPLGVAKMIAERFGISFKQKSKSNRKPLTLSEYTKHLKIPETFLVESFLLREGNKGIEIPFLDESHTQISVQWHHKLERGGKKDARFSWKEGNPYLYGAWDIPQWKDQEINSVLLCEGASDVQVCWFNHVAALGVPGASSFKREWTNLLFSFSEIVILQDPGTAGKGFVRRITDSLKEFNYQGVVKAIILPEKDPRDLWLRHGKNFKDELEAATSNASAIDLYPTIPLTSVLILKIAVILKRHVYFKDQRLPLLIAIWVLGTYVYEIFTFFGYLWINSPTKQCGKSLLGEILTQLSANATSRLSNLTEAVIFHLADQRKTLVIEELENVRREDHDKYGAIISLLNAGFQSGSKVPRMHKVEGGFELREFNAFCPKVLISINSINDTIEHRSFKISMVRKTKAEKVERFNLRRYGKELEALRKDLELWAEATRKGIEVL